MGRRLFPGILMFLLVLALAGEESLAYTYNHCPDSSQMCTINQDTGNQCEDVTSEMCGNGNVNLRGWNNLRSVWNGPFPFFGESVTVGSETHINSADIGIVLKSNDEECMVSVLSRDCSSGDIVAHKIYVGKDFVTKRVDVTGELSGCSGSYDISISPFFCRIDVDSVNLDVDYDITVPLGVLAASLSTDLPSDNTAGIYENFKAYSHAYCSGGDCGNVELSLQYREQDAAEFTDMPPSIQEGTPFFATPVSPYDCGTMNPGNDECSLEWSVTATETGSYEIRTIARSDNPGVSQAGSSHQEVDVVAGSLSLDNILFEPDTIETGDLTIMKADLSCLYHYCGDVAAYAKYGASKISNSTPFKMYDKNPQFINNMYPGTEHLEWTIGVDTPGQYDIYAAADSDIALVEEAYAVPPLTVKDPDVGSLSISEPGLSPPSIKEGESAVLQGVVECTNGPCGQVLARAQHAGADIPPTGTLSTSDNPRDCGSMEGGDSCHVSWDITGSSEGQYTGIRILAQSGGQGIPDAISQGFTLTVERNLDDILVSAQVTPSQINISENAVVSGEVGCSGSYCGELDAYLKYSDGSQVGTEGNLSTGEANPIRCQALPCGLHWDVTGNISNIYFLMVDVQSNESISNQTGSMPLSVINPEIPVVPSLHIDTIQDVSELVGTSFGISTKVFCFSADCGETLAYLQFKEGSQWMNLTQWTVLNTQDNMKTAVLVSDESVELTWEINSTQSSEFEMRMVAESIAAGSTHMYFISDIYPPGVPDVTEINIRSPKEHQVFSRGGDLSLELFATENYLPKEGLSPSASFSKSLYATIQLDDMGNGIYTSSVQIPEWADGEYKITFQSGDVQKTVDIEVDPSLDVWLSANRTEYVISETVSISGTVSKNNDPIGANLYIMLECQDGWKYNEPYSIMTDTSGVFQYSLTLPEYMPSGKCTITVLANDESENSGIASTNITVVNERNVYDVVFVEPSYGQKFTVGDDIDVSLKILMNGIPVDGAEVRCTDPYGNFNKILTINGLGEYSGTFKAERKGGGDSWNILCKTETTDGFLGSNSVDIKIIPLIEIDVISPDMNRTDIEKGDTIHFIILVKYSDGGYMDQGNVTAIIGNDTMPLDHTRSGTYEGSYTIKKAGEIEMAFVARDSEGNSKYYEMTFESLVIPYVNWLGVISTISGIVILWLLWFLNKTRHGKTMIRTVTKTIVKGPDRRSRLNDMIKDLEKEKTAIEKAKESAEMEYYHRKITEAEFRKMMEGYEQELLKKDAELQEFRKELESLVNTNK